MFMTVRILLVDDHDVVRRGLKALIEARDRRQFDRARRPLRRAQSSERSLDAASHSVTTPDCRSP
jgi:DNA-binding NarL/FixJ family response regulator